MLPGMRPLGEIMALILLVLGFLSFMEMLFKLLA
jgi:hypothetical protein